MRRAPACAIAAALAVLAAPLGARACDIRIEGPVSGEMPAYNPVSPDGARQDLSVRLAGPAGSRVWVRVQTPRPAQRAPEPVFLAETSSGIGDIGGWLGSAVPSDLSTLAARWHPVHLDAQGRGLARIAAVLAPGQAVHAGTGSLPLELLAVCETATGVEAAAAPLQAGVLRTRVSTVIAVSRTGPALLDFGALPGVNPDGWSPPGARSGFTVTATGSFSVILGEETTLLRNQVFSAPGEIATIPFRLSVATDGASRVEGPGEAIQCGPAGTPRDFEVQASLPANAAQGRLAGPYRGRVSVTVRPSELAAIGPGLCVAR